MKEDMNGRGSNNRSAQPRRQALRSSRGFTLTEMLVGSFVLLLVAGAITMVMSEGQHSFQSQQDIIEVTQDARLALDQIMTCIRQAGNDPEEVFAGQTPPFSHLHSELYPIEVSGPAHIQVSSDITGAETGFGNTGDPDGELNDRYEKVQIRYVTGADLLQIDISNGSGWQIMAENVADFDFTFYDLQGNDLGASPDESLIAKVAVEMKIESERPDLKTGKFQSITLWSEAMLRSQGFDVHEEL